MQRAVPLFLGIHLTPAAVAASTEEAALAALLAVLDELNASAAASLEPPYELHQGLLLVDGEAARPAGEALLNHLTRRSGMDLRHYVYEGRVDEWLRASSHIVLFSADDDDALAYRCQRAGRLLARLVWDGAAGAWARAPSATDGQTTGRRRPRDEDGGGGPLADGSRPHSIRRLDPGTES